MGLSTELITNARGVVETCDGYCANPLYQKKVARGFHQKWTLASIGKGPDLYCEKKSVRCIFFLVSVANCAEIYWRSNCRKLGCFALDSDRSGYGKNGGMMI